MLRPALWQPVIRVSDRLPLRESCHPCLGPTSLTVSHPCLGPTSCHSCLGPTCHPCLGPTCHPCLGPTSLTVNICFEKAAPMVRGIMCISASSLSDVLVTDSFFVVFMLYKLHFLFAGVHALQSSFAGVHALHVHSSFAGVHTLHSSLPPPHKAKGYSFELVGLSVRPSRSFF